MSNKSRLGRGLGGLISGSGSAPVQKPAPEVAKGAKKVAPKKKPAAKPKVVQPKSEAPTVAVPHELPLQSIAANPYQPRREINAQHVEELAKSIQAEGLIQPIVVRSKGKQFELIAGERRLRAFEHLGKDKIPVRVIEASDASSAALALIENLQRENLNPIDEALGYASLIRDFDLTQEAAATRVGKSRAAVANSLRLLSLDGEIQGFLSRRLISTGHAKVLLGVESEAQRKLLARRIIETGMSVREAESEVRRLKQSAGGSKGSRKVSDAEATAIRDLEKRIGEHFNSRVKLQHSPKKGKLTIEYFGNEDLDRILEKIGLR
jgi:ParB family chromosome partitioning protein